MQTDPLLEAGDLDGAAARRKIIAAIEAMRSTEADIGDFISVVGGKPDVTDGTR